MHTLSVPPAPAEMLVWLWMQWSTSGQQLVSSQSLNTRTIWTFSVFQWQMDHLWMASTAYSYDCADALRRIESLDVPWHPEKGALFFSEVFVFISMLWDIWNHKVSLPENKCLKYLQHVRDFITSFESHCCQLRDVEQIHGTFCYISFIYVEGRSHLPSLSNFAASFKGNEFMGCYAPPSLFTDLKWWACKLEDQSFYWELSPHGSTLNPGIFVDASTSWGIGIMFNSTWTTI